MTAQVRALSFGAVAEDYDRYRPTYPPQLVDDVCDLLPGRRIVEIGAGTGIATSQFATHDVDITCVEPDPAMAGVLAGKFVGSDAVRVDVATFEGWSAARDADAERFDGLICAQAWHWADPATRWRDAAAALSRGGLLALFWNRDGYADPDVLAALIEVYERHGGVDRVVLRHTQEVEAWSDEDIEAAVDFTNHEDRIYRWRMRQSVVDHVARLCTISAHLILSPDVQDAIHQDLVETLTGRFGSEIELAMNTGLLLARRR
jgi:SAM-dependent methyltransferase